MCPNLARVNPRTADLTTFQLRDEDNFDQRQSSAAAQASRSYQTVSEKRNDHNNDYIGHWPRKKRDGHEEAVDFARERSIAYGNKSQRHRDVRRLAVFFLNLSADLDSLVMIAGGKIGKRISTSFIRKTIIETFGSLSLALVNGDSLELWRFHLGGSLHSRRYKGFIML